jgi:hypothetical protein
MLLQKTELKVVSNRPSPHRLKEPFMKLARIALTLAALGFALGANAQLLFDFNAGSDSHVEYGTWANPSPNGTGAMLSKATVPGWQSGIKIGFYGDKDYIAGLAASNPNAYISFDVFIDHSAFPTNVSDWYQTTVAANSGVGGWKQFDNIFNGWHPAGRTDIEARTVTLSFAQIAWGTDPGWGYNLEFISNSGTAVLPLYMDNLAVVPEPTTAGLMGIGVLLLALRRK